LKTFSGPAQFDTMLAMKPSNTKSQSLANTIPGLIVLGAE
jgi:hypothetical protein